MIGFVTFYILDFYLIFFVFSLLFYDRQYTTDQFFDRTQSSNDSFPSISPSFPGEYVISISSRIPSVTSINKNISPSNNNHNKIQSVDSFDTNNQPEIDDLWEDSPPKNKQSSKKQKISDDSSYSTKTKEKGSRFNSGLIFVRRPKTLDLRFTSYSFLFTFLF